jgi:hypothetical protein
MTTVRLKLTIQPEAFKIPIITGFSKQQNTQVFVFVLQKVEPPHKAELSGAN